MSVLTKKLQCRTESDCGTNTHRMKNKILGKKHLRDTLLDLLVNNRTSVYLLVCDLS